MLQSLKDEIHSPLVKSLRQWKAVLQPNSQILMGIFKIFKAACLVLDSVLSVTIRDLRYGRSGLSQDHSRTLQPYTHSNTFHQTLSSTERELSFPSSQLHNPAQSRHMSEAQELCRTEQKGRTAQPSVISFTSQAVAASHCSQFVSM